jgi:hypothetical protein
MLGARGLQTVTLVLLTALSSCGPGSPDEGMAEAASDESSTETETETETGEPAPSCSCVDLELICSDEPSMAMADCELPSPCGVVDGSAEASTCVLELLIAGEPAKFEYDISGPGCGLGSENWSGWFYILGPSQGIDNECYYEHCDFSMMHTPSANHYAIAEPEYYADCLGKTPEVQTGCIFNGLSIGSSVAECGG